MARMALGTKAAQRIVSSVREAGAGSIARIVAIGLVCALSSSGMLRPLQVFIEDQRVRLVTRPATNQLLLLDIDEPSIRAVGVWPWSRKVHAAIIDKLRVLGAADIAFDIDFSSPSAPDGDAALEGALKRADGSVILAALEQVARAGSDGTALIASRPIPRFAANAWEASVDVWPDPDGRIRWFSRGETFGGLPLPSLATLLASASGQAEGRFVIDFGIDATQLAHVSVSELLAGAVGPALVRGRKVIVGASAIELRDFFEVPRFGLMAGSAVQAMAVESLLQGRALKPVSVPVTILVTALLLGAVCLGRQRLSYKVFLALCAGSAVVAEAGALIIQAVWPVIPITAPVHAGVLAFALIAVAEEITERRRKLLASRRNAGRLRVMLDRVVADNFAGIIIVDQDGLVRAASAAAAAILGTDLRTASPQPFGDMLPAPLAGLLVRAMAGARGGGVQPPSTCELEIEPAGRPAVLLDCVTTVSEVAEAFVSSSQGREFAICLTFKDITEERRAHARLAEMALVDSLSGLANRSVFLAEIENRHARQASRPSAVIFFDVDRFKLINDRLGHSSGDALIQAVASRLRTIVLPGDVAARLGGDEFALIIDRETPGDVQDFAEMLRRELGGLYEIGDYQPSIAISIGITYVADQGTTELMACADAALYAAKAAGGGCIRLFDAAMKAAAEEGKQLADDLRTALARGEFQVAYQRQVDARNERIIGVEALVRWKHPERGYISPAKFIPVAERTGLIEPIGMWVLATACRDALAWPTPIKVSVNLSAVQLARANLADLILETLANIGLPPARLDLELTESLLMDNDDLVQSTLCKLREAGVKISLDDFGTGYSSLSYLNTFAIDKIKIDQSFVRNLCDSRSAEAIVRAVVSLAQDLGLRVNAEGVETVEQLRLLRQLSCDEIQGYLHGRPEPSPAIHASLVGQKRAEELYASAA